MAEMQAARMNVSRSGTTLVLSLEGDWLARSGLPGIEPVEKELKDGSVKTLEFESAKLGRWDSGLLAFLMSLAELCERLKVQINSDSLPEGVRKLIRLSEAVPEKEDARRQETKGSLVHGVGELALQTKAGVNQMLNLLGEVALAGVKLFRR